MLFRLLETASNVTATTIETALQFTGNATPIELGFGFAVVVVAASWITTQVSSPRSF
jgi:hypothetical protein